MDVRIALQHLKGRQGEVAKHGLERHIKSEEKKLDRKTELNQVLDAADQLGGDGNLTYIGDDSDLVKLNAMADARGVKGPGTGNREGAPGFMWNGEATKIDGKEIAKYEVAQLGNPDDALDERANHNKKHFDNWKKTVTRELESMDDGQAMAQIKLQQLNNTMLNAEGARTDLQKQTHDLDKKIRDNIYTSSV